MHTFKGDQAVKPSLGAPKETAAFPIWVLPSNVKFAIQSSDGHNVRARKTMNMAS